MEKMRGRYGRAQGRLYKSRLIEEAMAVGGYSRKHAIKLLNNASGKPRALKRSGPKRQYGGEVVVVVKRIWMGSDQLCGKRLKAALDLWLPHYEKEYGAVGKAVREKLMSISAATIDRLLGPMRAKVRPKGKGGTKPGRWLKNQIPIKTGQWDEKRPGFMEADTVAHCGESLEGDFLWSLVFSDIATGWTEMRATWNKGALGIVDAARDIEAHLPFALLGFDCDNGSEFLNHHLWRHFSERKKPVQYTRSRPYHKNDNAHVEQKNWTHVRSLLGYERLELPQLVQEINALYSGPWQLYHNHFCPSVKLLEKKRDGSRYVRRHDKPKTPLERVLESGVLSASEADALRAKHQTLNPFELKRQIEAALRKIQKIIRLGASCADSAPVAPALRSGTPSAKSAQRLCNPNLTENVA